MGSYIFFFFQAEDGIRGGTVTGVQTCALPISALEGDDGELLRVGRPGAGGVDESQRVHVRIGRRRGQAPDDFAAARVGEEEVDVEDVACGEEGEVVAVRAERGPDVEHAALAFSRRA